MAHRWQLVAEQCFTIRGRGLVVVGSLEGQPAMGDRAVLTTPDGQTRHVAVLGIDQSHARHQGDVTTHIGVLVNVTDMAFVPRGATLRAEM